MLILFLVSLFILVAFVFAITISMRILLRRKASKSQTSNFLRKYPEVDIEQYRGTFLRLGFIAAILLAIMAFSWTTYEKFDLPPGPLTPENTPVFPPQTAHQREVPKPPPILKIVKTKKESIDPEIVPIDPSEPITFVEVPDEPFDYDKTFKVVEEMPQFPGGDKALMNYLAKTDYPRILQDNGIVGDVWVKFVVNKKGKVADVSIERGIDPLLDEAALKQVRLMPKWKPGKQRGKPVKVQYIVRIKFKLI